MGNSLGVSLPKVLIEKLTIAQGDDVEFIENDCGIDKMTMYLTTEEVIEAHYMMMKRMNDMAQAGIKNRGLLESAVHRSQQTPTLMDEAAALLESVVKVFITEISEQRTSLRGRSCY